MRRTIRLLCITSVIAAMATLAHAVAPSKEAIAKFKAEGTYEKVMADMAAFKAAGGCAPVIDNYLKSSRHLQRIAAGLAAPDTLRVPVILVDFPDYHWDSPSYPIPSGGTLHSVAAGTPAMFDSVLFSVKGQPGANPTGSMTDYYKENSYDSLVVTGKCFGWYTVSENYSYYVGTNSGLGGGGAILAHDAVLAAYNAGVDFTPYANGGSSVDVVIIHAGPGAEIGQYGIWSHRSSLSPSVVVGSVYVANYTMNPEEYTTTISPIGVFCHEYGHILGLPDLYDTDPTHTLSEGLGEWSLMASGNYNGDSKVPAELDPWCKGRLNFVKLNDHLLQPNTNLSHVAIPQVESQPFVYKIASTVGATEYFLIENRQFHGFDAGLPGEGLLIYHVDELQPDNNDPSHYKVALLQADGLNSLALGAGGYSNRGDYGDPWPGTSNNRNWHDLSNPNSRTYAGATTQFAAWNISNSDSVMYADLDTRWSRPWLALTGTDSLKFSDVAPGGNGNGIIEAGETISFTFGVRNFMRLAYGHSAHLSCDDPSLIFDVNNVAFLDPVLNPLYMYPSGPATPITFTIPSDWQTHVVHFALRILIDSLASGQDTTWNKTFTFSQPLGKTNVLLVDDDNGHTFETRYGSALTNLGIPYDIWNVKVNSSPLAMDLNKYKNVFWFTGNETILSGTLGGTIDDLDILAMKGFLDAGGNLCLSSITAPAQMAAIDTSFLSNYLHAQNAGLTPDGDVVALYAGVSGNPVSDGISVGIQSAPVTYRNMVLNPVNGGQPAFTLKSEDASVSYGNGGVTYSGAFRTVYLPFAMEFLIQNTYPPVTQPIDTLMHRILTFFQKGSATGVDEGNQAVIPDEFTLEQNYPNPFNPSTVISYTIPAGTRPQRTTVAVFNLVGQEVATIADRVEGPGHYTATWDTKGRVASGTYFYRLSHGNSTLSRKMVLLK